MSRHGALEMPETELTLLELVLPSTVGSFQPSIATIRHAGPVLQCAQVAGGIAAVLRVV